MSFTLRPFASAALLLSMAGLCAGTLLAAEQTEPSEASAVRARPLVLGVVETAEPSFDDNTVRPVLKAMQSAAPGTQIDVVRLSSATFEVAVAQLKPDLVISPAADFLRIVDSIGAHPIGTRKTKYAKHPSKSAGGAVIALASRTDIQKLTDLRGKYIAATLPTSVDGMLAVRMELAERGFDSRQFFRSVRYLGYSMPNVIESVLSGHFDAGVVPVCTLERIEAEDLIERGALRVISPKSDDDTVCAHTSELYPDLVAATFSWTDPELTRLTTSALLASKSADAEFNWYGTSDFHRIRALEETLQIGPWAYLQEMTPEALWRRWRFALFAVLAGLGLLLLNEWRLRRLVAKRTGELKRSMEERDRLAQRERAVRDQLSSLERMGAISQLCAMIAHELKQPVGAVINYVAVVKLKLGLQTVPGLPGETALNTSERPVDPLLLRALAGAEGEAHRIAAIVDRVRSYARRQHADPVPVDIVREAQNALRSLKAELRPFVVIRPPFSLTADDASKRRLIMRGDPLEIELLLLNVMKNAAEAVQGLPDGAVLVDMSAVEVVPFTGGRLTDFVGGDVWLNAEGRRFVSEGETFDVIRSAVEAQPEGRLWVVSDVKSNKGATLPVKLMSGTVASAESLEALAKALQVPFTTLRASIDRWNQSVKSGWDQDFNRPMPAQAQTIDTPPFYYGEERFSIHYTSGGIAISPKAQVLDRDDHPIPGLYAAGETTGGVHGRTRLGGCALTDCFVFGRIAGKEAALRSHKSLRPR